MNNANIPAVTIIRLTVPHIPCCPRTVGYGIYAGDRFVAKYTDYWAAKEAADIHLARLVRGEA